MYTFEIQPGQITLNQLRQVARNKIHVTLATSAIPAINKSQALVNQMISEDHTVYGINTGFGLLANTRIEVEDLEELQRSIVLSHAAGIGKFMEDSTVRLMMVLKVNSLSRGFSGIRLSVIEALMTLINTQVFPCIPEKGSVGASGDLAPLAHMSAVLLGEGQARYRSEIISGQAALKIAGLDPITLAPKEGLALLNGTKHPRPLLYKGYSMPKTCGPLLQYVALCL